MYLARHDAVWVRRAGGPLAQLALLALLTVSCTGVVGAGSSGGAMGPGEGLDEPDFGGDDADEMADGTPDDDVVGDQPLPPADVPRPPAAQAPEAARPQELCKPPIALLDTSRPATVVGTGTPASCTEAALRSAVSKGGIVTFDCGDAKATIAITQTLEAPSDRDTTIDGEDRIVLDGGGKTQILRARRENFRANDRVLAVQRLTMIGGRDEGEGFLERKGSSDCAWGYKTGGGGAIYAEDVNVHLWGVTFENNRGPELGPDVAGGAVYVVGAKKLVVANSVFRNNSAANGGAIGLLHTSAELYNVVLEKNRATGMFANFANASGCPKFNHDEQGGAGGLGGAFYSDGFDPGDTFCGVRMADNSSGDLGGGVFRSAYWGLLADTDKQTIVWEKSTFERNRAAKGGGAAYVNNSLFQLRECTFSDNESDEDGGGLKLTGLTLRAENVQFSNNKGEIGGGIAHWEGGPEGVGSSASIKFAGNLPDDYIGDFPR